MTMGLPLRCRYWSVLQVVAIIICYRGKDLVSSEMAQDCVGSRLSLTCPRMKVIQIVAVVLGDSYCLGASCCIRDDDCTHNPNENHRTDVHSRCDNRQSCSVDVLKEKIPCGTLVKWSNNDFERITYNCLDDLQNDTTNSTADEGSTENYHSTDYNSDEEQTKTADYSVSSRLIEKTEEEEDDYYLTSTDGTLGNHYNHTEVGPLKYESNSQTLTVILVIICLIILLAIVVFLAVMYRRKKDSQVKLFDPVAMTEVDNRPNESDINANQTQGTSLPENNNPLSLYNLTDQADFPKADEDPAVYSEVELRETVWKESQSDRVTTDKTNAAIEAHTAGPDGAKGLVNNGDCFRDHIYSLASNDMADIYANETAVDASTQSKTPSPEDDGGLTVIENDLYCH